MADNRDLVEFLLRMGDTTLILGHRVSEWCGHAPILEEDIAMANIALDLIGQTQLWLELAGEVEGKGRTADILAYHRDVWDFRNFLLVERPNNDFGHTLMRQFLFDAWHKLYLTALLESTNVRVAEVAEKALKEVSYHYERSSDVIVRLGDGTDESHSRMQSALDLLWPYTGEMFVKDEVDDLMEKSGIGPNLHSLRSKWNDNVSLVLQHATLSMPNAEHFQQGGKQGRHSEHLGHILSDMQFLQRAYPNASW